MERQNVSENNINTTLVALTAQLQQLTQLVANPLLCPYQTHLPHWYYLLRCLCPPLWQQDECVPSSSVLQTSVENIIMAAHSWTPAPSTSTWPWSSSTMKKEFSGLSCSSKAVMPPSGLKTCSVRKRTLAFSLFKPRETLSNNSGFTSSLLMQKQM